MTKRSVSLDDEVATAVEEAARQDNVSFSAWLSSAAQKQLRVRQGLRGVAAWEGETGSLSAEEVAAGEALLARLRSGVSGVASARPTSVSGSSRREGLAYGLGALHAAARGERMMWALHRAALSNGIVPVVPALTVAEGYRSEARSDRIAELLAGTEVEPFTGEMARRAGEIAARCDTSDLSVVAVIELAERRNCAVVAQRQAVMRTAAALLGHRLVLYTV